MEACIRSVLYFCLRSIVLAFLVYEKFGFNNFNIIFFYHNSRSDGWSLPTNWPNSKKRLSDEVSLL